MKKYLAFLLLAIASIAQSQVDIKITTIGPYQNLARGVAWGATGIGNTDNSYIWTPQTSASLACVYVANNNPSSSHSFTITLLTTGDPQNGVYNSGTTAQKDKWRTLSTATSSVSANSIAVFSFSSLAAAFAQVQISGTSTESSSPDTADIYIVQSNTNLDCLTSTIPVAGTVTINISQSCAKSAVLASTTASSLQIIATPPAGEFIHVCAYSVTGGVPSDGSGDALISFKNGTAGSCTSTGTDQWDVFVTTGGAANNVGSGLGQLFQTTVAAQPLCVVNAGTSITQHVSVSYSIS